MSNQECAITDERAAAKDNLQFCFEEFHSYAYYSRVLLASGMA